MPKQALALFRSFLLIFALLSCDDGRIYDTEVILPEEGRVVKFTGEVIGNNNWTDKYSVVLAGFDDEGEYAIITKTVPLTGKTEVVLSGISDEVTRMELCVINRLRKRIVTLQAFECPATTDTIRLEATPIDAGMYATIQDRLFNTTCAACHGYGERAAAGLFLTEGRSHAALVGQPSVKMPGMHLVAEGNAEESVLYQTLASEVSTGWGYDHTKEVLSPAWLELLKDWIDAGAKE